MSDKLKESRLCEINNCTSPALYDMYLNDVPFVICETHALQRIQANKYRRNYKGHYHAAGEHWKGIIVKQ